MLVGNLKKRVLRIRSRSTAIGRRGGEGGGKRYMLTMANARFRARDNARPSNPRTRREYRWTRSARKPSVNKPVANRRYTGVSIEFRTADSYLVGDETRTSLSTGVLRKLECERDGAMARSERTRDPRARLESHRIRIPLEECSLALSDSRMEIRDGSKTEKFLFSFLFARKFFFHTYFGY